jgi:DnaJ-class molecular chaperone
MVTLGIDPRSNPTMEQIKAAWKEKCRVHHPDVGGDREKFDEVTHAYRMLTDAKYSHEFMLDEIKRERHASRGNLDVQMDFPISFAEGFFGTLRRVSVARTSLDKKGRTEETTFTEVFNLTVPPGSTEMHREVLKGKGIRQGECAGNLIVRFNTRPHEVFKVNGVNLVGPLQVPLVTALRGGKMDVATMVGIKTVTIPPGTKHGDEIIIPRCGVPPLGEQIMLVNLVYPEKEELKGEDWKDFGINWDLDEGPKPSDQAITVYINGRAFTARPGR